MMPSGVVIAHRAGNSLERLAGAGAVADVVEADVHLFRGRLEVRHAKTLGPFPRLWERWYLLEPDAPRLLLEEVLAAAHPGIALMLDLKGPDPRLPRAVLAAARERLAGPGLIVSGRGPVDDLDTARALAAWGVTGFISDAPERLAPLRANAPAKG